MAEIARRVLGITEDSPTEIAAPDWSSLLLAAGLVLAFLAVGFGLPGGLPLQAASWLTFLALVITPGYLLGDMVTWRLDLDLLGLDLPGCKVYRVDTTMKRTSVAFDRNGPVLTFPVRVDGDWAEFLIR